MHYRTSDQESITLGFGGHECNNGVHFCGFYETAQDRDDIILGYLRQGILDKAQVLYTPTERTAGSFTHEYRTRYPHDPELGDNPRFVMNTAKDLYYPDGVFSPLKMTTNLDRFFEESQKNGKINVRTTAEMVWALDIGLDRIQLMAYESRLNYFIPGKPWISICMYNLTRFSGQLIMGVLQTHPFTVSKGGSITKNPYYIDPDEWLARNAPQYQRHAALPQ